MIRRDGREIWVRQVISMMRFSGTQSPVQLGVMDDITAERLAERQMEESNEQLQFLNDIAKNLLVAGNPDNAIQDVLHKILEYFDGSRAYIMEMDYGKQVSSNTYEVCADGAQSKMAGLQGIPREATKAWWAAFEKDGHVCIEDTSALAGDRAEEGRILLTQGIRSLTAVPMRRDGVGIGFVVVDDPCMQKAHVDRLKALGDYIAVMLTRRDLNAKIANDGETLQNMMNDMPGGFCRMRMRPGRTSGLVYANDGFCKLVSMTHAEVAALYGADAFLGLHPDDRDRARNAAERFMETGGRFSDKYRLRCGADGYIWAMVFGRVTEDASGERYLNLYYADLTEHEKQALSFSEMLPVALAAMMESSNDLAFVKNKDLAYVCCSKAFAQMVGLQNEKDVAGKTDYDLFDRALAEQYRADDFQLMESGVSLVDNVEQIPGKDGIMRYSSTSKYLLLDSFGSCIGLYGTGRDITESRTADARLKLFTESPTCGIAMFALSPEGLKTLYFSDGFRGFSGYTREEYEALTRIQPLYLVFDEDRAALLSAFDALLYDKPFMDVTYRCHTKDGRCRWLNMRGAVTERQGDTAVINTVQFDITEQKAAEAALHVR